MHFRSLGISALVCAAMLSGCVWLSGNRTTVYNVSDVPFHQAGNIEEVGERIRRAARMAGWEVQEVQPQVFYVTKRRGSHSATASVNYDIAAFSIQFRASENLKQSDTRIHKLYNEWIHELELTIQNEVATGL
jgi:hypothetical protein